MLSTEATSIIKDFGNHGDYSFEDSKRGKETGICRN